MRTFLYLQVLALILISPHSLVHGYISSSNLFARNSFSHRQLPSHGSALFSTFEESILGSTLLFEANPPILTFGQIEIDQIERLKVLAEKEFPLDEYLTYDMPNHTPLGCTAKEYSVEGEKFDCEKSRSISSNIFWNSSISFIINNLTYSNILFEFLPNLKMNMGRNVSIYLKLLRVAMQLYAD